MADEDEEGHEKNREGR